MQGISTKNEIAKMLIEEMFQHPYWHRTSRVQTTLKTISHPNSWSRRLCKVSRQLLLSKESKTRKVHQLSSKSERS